MSEKKPRTARVRMAPGRQMPAPAGVVIDTAVTVMTPETEVEVLLDHRFTRRRLEAGDWVRVDGEDAPRAAEAERPVAGAAAEPPLFEDRDTKPMRMTPHGRGHRSGHGGEEG